jgi:hypothetical protein
VHDLTAAASTPAELYRAASRGAARPGYDGVSIGIHVPVKQLAEGSVRCLHTRVRPARRPLAHPQHITATPRIGDIAAQRPCSPISNMATSNEIR